MNPLPPLRAMEVFEAVGHCGGITQAARRLGISTGAVSQQMKILEQALGISLMVKAGQRLRLNPSGQRFHARCTAAFEALRLAVDEAHRSRDPHSLSISGLPSLLHKWLGPLIGEWEQHNPTVSVYLDSSLNEDLTLEGVDFRIGYGDSLQEGEHGLELFQDCVVPVCAPPLIAAGGPFASAEPLARLPLIRVDSRPKFDSPPSWESWFATAQVVLAQPLHIPRTFSSTGMAIEAALLGQGVVLAPYSMVGKELGSGRLVIAVLHPSLLPSPYQLRWASEAFHKPQCRSFQRWLVARGRAQQALTQALLASVAAGAVVT
ncbi:MAG: LysR substrate-binding domain-containing protein [Pseudomonas sp.]|uniref:LysR substrate-binding domain-containing protein n=1 Tax=Pseudomonas abieticivorans TaxID=2931382 RepID=UPI0020C1085D|nr:LysR substrate-binding domain-containing protein [Pseudomonas sp. PIA16]MDE1164542.1 LysR substrate-binding domain-containing protein [Pseudomonas sp.]